MCRKPIFYCKFFTTGNIQKTFPQSLFDFIAEYSNQRIQIYNSEKKSVFLLMLEKLCSSSVTHWWCYIIKCHNFDILFHLWDMERKVQPYVRTIACLFFSNFISTIPKKNMPEGSCETDYIRASIPLQTYFSEVLVARHVPKHWRRHVPVQGNIIL